MQLSALNIEERRAFQRAKRLGYLRTEGRNPRLAGMWAAHCDCWKRPFLKIRFSGEYATLFLDTLQTNVILTKESHETIADICKLIGGQWYEITPKIVWGSGLPRERAEPFAQMLLQLVKKILPSTEPYVSRIA